MGAQTETELKEKKLRVEDALNATKVRWHYSAVSGRSNRVVLEEDKGRLQCSHAIGENLVLHY